jgi:hypothetical protein
MLYWLTGLSDGGDFFNLFRYITFRAGGAFFTALIFGFMFGRPLIDFLRRKQKKGQPIRDDGPQTHFVQGGHADDGRASDPVGAVGLDPALGAAGQWLCLDRAAGDDGLWPDRLCR